MCPGLFGALILHNLHNQCVLKFLCSVVQVDVCFRTGVSRYSIYHAFYMFGCFFRNKLYCLVLYERNGSNFQLGGWCYVGYIG